MKLIPTELRARVSSLISGGGRSQHLHGEAGRVRPSLVPFLAVLWLAVHQHNVRMNHRLDDRVTRATATIKAATCAPGVAEIELKATSGWDIDPRPIARLICAPDGNRLVANNAEFRRAVKADPELAVKAVAMIARIERKSGPSGLGERAGRSGLWVSAVKHPAPTL